MSLCSDIKNKSKIDTTTWKEFKIGNLFEVTRGKRIVKHKDYRELKNESMKYPVITAKTINNGIDGYYWNYNCEANSITVGGEASGMYAFYQEEKCWVIDRARILKPKFNMTKNIGLFFLPLFRSYAKYFSYAKSANPKEIKKLLIKLPIDINGNPNWNYMESFVTEIYNNFFSLNKLSTFTKQIINKNVVDSKNWKEFQINELFFVSRGKRIVRTRDYVNKKDNEYIYPVITPKIADNGIDGWYDNFNCKGNCIVSNGDVSGMFSFYQDSKCWVLDTSRILLPKFKQFNKFMGLFICSLLRKFTIYFSFQRKANPSDIEKLVLKLPVDQEGNPDWQYMEDYIKSLPYSKYLKE